MQDEDEGVGREYAVVCIQKGSQGMFAPAGMLHATTHIRSTGSPHCEAVQGDVKSRQALFSATAMTGRYSSLSLSAVEFENARCVSCHG